MLVEEAVMKAEQLLDSEMERIKEELQGIIGTLIAGCENLDVESAFRVFWNSPDFLMMGSKNAIRHWRRYRQMRFSCHFTVQVGEKGNAPAS